jgi:hypothetical protein
MSLPHYFFGVGWFVLIVTKRAAVFAGMASRTCRTCVFTEWVEWFKFSEAGENKLRKNHRPIHLLK